MGNAISSDTVNCKAVWLFNGDVIDRMTAQVTLTEVVSAGLAFDDTDKMEGSSCITFANQPHATAYLVVSDANLPLGFPGRRSAAPVSFTVVLWFMVTDTLAFSQQQGLFSKWDIASGLGGGRAILCSLLNSAQHTRFGIGIHDGSGSQVLDLNSAEITANSWYHYAASYDATSTIMRLSVYSQNLSATITCGSVTPSTGMCTLGTTAALAIGGQNITQVSAAKRLFTGKIDEVAIFTQVLPATSIDSIRAGTFFNISTAAPGGGFTSFGLSLGLDRKLQT